MSDRKFIQAELQNIQSFFGARADMAIGNGKMKLLSWANACGDAVELLKERQPKVLTEEDFIDNPLVDNNGNVPAWCEHMVFNGIAHDVDGWTAINQRWVCGFRAQRYWTARPTDEQRKATPWDEPPKEGGGE